MKSSLLLLPAIFLFNSAIAFQSESTVGAHSETLNIERVKRVSDSLANSLISDNQLAGMSIAVAREGEILFSKGYGLSSIELEVEATPETVYKIASITKQFTAAIILRLVHEGKLELDDPLEKYLPDYPAHGATITVWNLLTHTSGIGSKKFINEEEKISARRKSFYALSNEEMLEMFADAPLEFTPGQQHAYRNQNYILLGMIIEKVTGQPYQQFLRQFVNSLGLEQTGYCDELAIIKNRAQGYEVDDEQLYNASYFNMSNPGAAGGMCSTVKDLVRWNHLLHSGQVVNEKYLKEMIAPAILTNGSFTNYGFGLKLGKLGNNKKIYHGGSIKGFNSVLEFYPEQDLTIVVMTNTGSGKDEEISEAIARAALGIELRTITLSAEERAQFEGTYTIKADDDTMELRFFTKDEQLMVDFSGEGITPLLYQGNNKFVAALDPDIEFTFLQGTANKYEIQVNMHGQLLQGKRN